MLGVAATAVYLVTLEPTVSFWDCGEFIATSYGLQVGHPPGAPTYNLLIHCLMLLAGGNTEMLAWWSNALSAIAGGATVGLLYATIVRMSAAAKQKSTAAANSGEGETESTERSIGAAVGSLCYLFCDTAWFSATESEVYSTATFFASVIVWASLRADESLADGKDGVAQRWLLLASLMTGLGVGVHQLVLLALPSAAVTLISVGRAKQAIARVKKGGASAKKQTLARWIRAAVAMGFFFVLGLSTYCTVPMRAATKPEICYGEPATKDGFADYVKREQYAKAPLWPRSWRMRPDEAQRYAEWRGKGGDLQLLAGYQLGYMYMRYLMWNFSGRFNSRQGVGGLQNGQFITGIPPVDALIVGTGRTPPQSIGGKGHNRYFMLPLLLGIYGAYAQWSRRRKAFWSTLTLFLTGGIVLGLYINHPIYEPRERDYAYILSFYAYTVWIAFGAIDISTKTRKLTGQKRGLSSALAATLMAVPALMAWQNWDDHDRSGRYTALDTAANMLNSCEKDAILITYGDNDTFPLWYAQQVAGIRRDIKISNVNLSGGQSWLGGELAANAWRRPVYFSSYMRDYYGRAFERHLRLEGMCYRLCAEECDTIGVEEFYNLCTEGKIAWHILEGTHIDPIGHQFIEQYWDNVLKVASRLTTNGDTRRTKKLLATTERQLPVTILANKRLVRDIGRAYRDAGEAERYGEITVALKETIATETEYYNSIRRSLSEYVARNYRLPTDFWDD